MNTRMVHRSDTSRGHSLKLVKHHCHTDFKKFACKLRVVDSWNNLPARVMESNLLLLLKKDSTNFNFGELSM